ncbi:winged helix-turn-helix transcriptional regulator [Emticicia sp. SJ17W-69]|uniref:winged helix-turn-helix transcriptional regulator n=1 Tax=Emticicia sp. SJ17W-69 TaxID=3421657 RepID=UPI003EC11E85
METSKECNSYQDCPVGFILAIKDTLNVMNGKWKLPIIGVLLFGKRRFKDLEKNIPKITPRMLSKELKELEINGIIVRKVQPTIPVTVEYELSDSGKSLKTVLDSMIKWGSNHRIEVMGKPIEVFELDKLGV